MDSSFLGIIGELIAADSRIMHHGFHAVYDLCATLPAVSRVWFKQMMIGMNVNFALIVEADQYNSELEEKLRAAAEPLAKNVPVQILKYTPELEKKAVDGAVALYDRELNL